MTKKETVLKYTPRLWITTLYFLLIIFSLLIYTSKNWAISFFSVLSTDFYSHISNFSISLIISLSVGYIWLLMGVYFRFIAIFLGIIGILNVLCETVMGFMNTADLQDALYGIIGVGIAFVFLLIMSKYGVVVYKKEENKN